MQFGLDYLSAHLERKGYTLQRFEEEAASPCYNQETGEITNTVVPLSCYRKDVHGGNIVIGTYKGGQYGFAPIVIRESLKVTRLDIKCDIQPQEGYNANEYGDWMARQIRNFFYRNKRQVTYQVVSKVSADLNAPKTHLFGSRASEYQIRIYSKNGTLSQVLRVEFQLRKELARSVWGLIQSNVYSYELLAKAFASLEARILETGLLHLDWQAEPEPLQREPEPEVSDREAWIRTQVKSAVIKHFKETGVDLSFVLYMDVQNYFMQVKNLQEAYDKTSERLKRAERLFNE
jgi:hypothetical protein